MPSYATLVTLNICDGCVEAFVKPCLVTRGGVPEEMPARQDEPTGNSLVSAGPLDLGDLPLVQGLGRKTGAAWDGGRRLVCLA